MGASFKMDPSPDGLSREDALFMAKAAEQAERYEEMVKYMKRIVQLCESGDEMSNANASGVEERNLISVGYKNMMSHRRTAHRTVQQFEDKEVKNNGPNVQLMKDYKEEEYKDSTLIMQLLKDNLTLWNESGADSGDD